jgi:hypothetical protein
VNPKPIIPMAYGRPIVEVDAEFAAEEKNRIECSTGLCATCGDRIDRDGTCAHVAELFKAAGDAALKRCEDCAPEWGCFASGVNCHKRPLGGANG